MSAPAVRHERPANYARVCAMLTGGCDGCVVRVRAAADIRLHKDVTHKLKVVIESL